MTTTRREELIRVLHDAHAAWRVHHDPVAYDGPSLSETLADAVLPLLPSAPEGTSLDHLLTLGANEREAGNQCGCRAWRETTGGITRIRIKSCSAPGAPEGELAAVIRDEARRHPPGTDIDEGCAAIAHAVRAWLGKQPNPDRTRAALYRGGWIELERQLAAATTLRDTERDNFANAVTQQGEALVDAKEMIERANARAEAAERTAAIGHALLSQIHAALGLAPEVSLSAGHVRAVVDEVTGLKAGAQGSGT